MKPTRSSSLALPKGMLREPFGTTPEGHAVERYTLASASGVTINVLTYGGVIQSVFAPDRAGVLADVTLGYDTLDGYLRDKSYLGALVGRYANRIRAGRFSLDGRDYALATNAGTNHLHGGVRGFNKAVWMCEPFAEGENIGLVLGHFSPDILPFSHGQPFGPPRPLDHRDDLDSCDHTLAFVGHDPPLSSCAAHCLWAGMQPSAKR